VQLELLQELAGNVSPEPSALHGVKSPARLATSSGGFVIVHVRPAGEPARTSRSARGASLAGTGLRSLPVGFGGQANDAAASFATNETKRGGVPARIGFLQVVTYERGRWGSHPSQRSDLTPTALSLLLTPRTHLPCHIPRTTTTCSTPSTSNNSSTSTTIPIAPHIWHPRQPQEADCGRQSRWSCGARVVLATGGAT
jgi:hypothetical protein